MNFRIFSVISLKYIRAYFLPFLYICIPLPPLYNSDWFSLTLDIAITEFWILQNYNYIIFHWFAYRSSEAIRLIYNSTHRQSTDPMPSIHFRFWKDILSIPTCQFGRTERTEESHLHRCGLSGQGSADFIWSFIRRILFGR